MKKDTENKIRCFGVDDFSEMAKYHDDEWGVPSHDDKHLFEMLILEGAQAGLNWETILKRRSGYKELFHGFDPKKVSKMTDSELDEILKNPKIIRNKLKVYSARQNAKVFLEIQKEFGSFDKYLWEYVNFKPIKNKWTSKKQVPAKTDLSDTISKDLKKRGMSFVGSTIIYAYLQAVGVIDDHLMNCYLGKASKSLIL